MPEAFTDPITGKQHIDLFTLNDIDLIIPPIQISIVRNPLTFSDQALRSRASIKSKSGHGTINIGFDVAFIGRDQINEQLRPLLIQANLSPFFRIENDYLRTTVLGGDSGTMVLCLTNLSVSLQSGNPDTISAHFETIWFNYKPYSLNYTLKQDFSCPGEPGTMSDLDPAKPDLWSRYWRSIERQYPPAWGGSSRSNNELEVQWNDFAIGPSKTKKEIEGTIAQLDQQEQALEDFLEKREKKLNADKISEKNSTLVERILADSPETTDIKEMLLRAERVEGQKQYVEEKSKLELLKNELVELENKGFDISQPFTDPRGDNYSFYRRKNFLSLHNPEKYLIVTAINLSVGNQLALLPVNSYMYPTVQFLGGLDRRVTINLSVLSESSLRELQVLYNTVENSTTAYRFLPPPERSLRIRSNFLSLAGFIEGTNFFTVDSMNVSTIPGSPGTFDVELVLTEQSISELSYNGQLSQEGLISDQELRKAVWRRVEQELLEKFHLAKNGFDSVLFKPDQKKARFIDIIVRFAEFLAEKNSGQLIDLAEVFLIQAQKGKDRVDLKDLRDIPFVEVFKKLVGLRESEAAARLESMEHSPNASIFRDNLEDYTEELVKFTDSIVLTTDILNPDLEEFSEAQKVASEKGIDAFTNNYADLKLTAMQVEYHDWLEKHCKIKNKIPLEADFYFLNDVDNNQEPIEPAIIKKAADMARSIGTSMLSSEPASPGEVSPGIWAEKYIESRPAEERARLKANLARIRTHLEVKKRSKKDNSFIDGIRIDPDISTFLTPPTSEFTTGGNLSRGYAQRTGIISSSKSTGKNEWITQNIISTPRVSPGNQEKIDVNPKDLLGELSVGGLKDIPSSSNFDAFRDALPAFGRQYAEFIWNASIKQGFHPAYLAAIIQQESNFNPEAIGHGVDFGLGQINKNRHTAGWFAVNDWKDPKTNIDKAAEFLGDGLRHFHSDIRAAISEYNIGYANVRNSLNKKLDPGFTTIPNGRYPDIVLNNYQAIKNRMDSITRNKTLLLVAK